MITMRILRLFLAVFSITMCGTVLSAQMHSSVGFNLIVVGDPQPQTEAQMRSLEQDIIPQIGAIVDEYNASGYPTAILLTGDVVWDTVKFLPRVKRAFESLGVPIYAVIGNHDHNKHRRLNQRRAESAYTSTFGPRNQSFTLGNTLFVTFDNIDFHGRTNYRIDIDAEQLAWFDEVMQGVAAEQRVAVCMHAPVTNFRSRGVREYAAPLMTMLAGHETHFITGHAHRHHTLDIAPGVVEHNVAQVNGTLWFAPICSDGTPRGVFCIEERDNVWRWRHRIFGASADDVLVAWQEGEVEDNEEYVVVKAVGWDCMWRVEWSAEGIHMGAMEQIEIVDPDFAYYVEHEADYAPKYMERLRRVARPHNHYFRCRRPHPETPITITATDRFGRRHSVSVE